MKKRYYFLFVLIMLFVIFWWIINLNCALAVRAEDHYSIQFRGMEDISNTDKILVFSKEDDKLPDFTGAGRIVFPLTIRNLGSELNYSVKITEVPQENQNAPVNFIIDYPHDLPLATYLVKPYSEEIIYATAKQIGKSNLGTKHYKLDMVNNKNKQIYGSFDITIKVRKKSLSDRIRDKIVKLLENYCHLN